jgi:hypothetical protein
VYVFQIATTKNADQTDVLEVAEHAQPEKHVKTANVYPTHHAKKKNVETTEKEILADLVQPVKLASMENAFVCRTVSQPL